MDDDIAIVPGSPHEFGVPLPELPIEKVEPAHQLASDAREELLDAGFADEQIISWADAFFADHAEGGVAELIAWIGEREVAAG